MAQKRLLLSIISAAALAACGGGSDDPAVAGAPAGPAFTTTTISGTAAVGAAIAAAVVNAKCASGSGSATTAADGSFKIEIDDAVRPCVLAVPAPGGGTLHSLVEAGTGTAAVANITPLSELMVAQIAAGDTAEFFAAFDAAAQAKLTQEGVSAARDSVKLALTGIVDLSGVDPVQDALVAANGSNAGNGLDQTLDALGVKLAAAQVGLVDVSAAMAANPGSAAPLQTMLQASASGCASLKSGTYRSLELLEGAQAENSKVSIDATALTVTMPDGSIEPMTDQGGCHFSFPDGVSMYVAKSGAAVVYDSVDGVPALPVLVIPEQTLALSELAGKWNAFGHERGGPGEPWSPVAVSISFDAAGKLTAGAECENFETCTPWDDVDASVSVHPDGGFVLTDSEGSTRLFAFKAPDGQLTLVTVGEYGFFVAGREQAQTLPAVGTERRFWDFSVNGKGVLGPAFAGSFAVTAVDAAAKSQTRLRASDNRVDSWTADTFRNGVSYRAANSMTIDGVSQQHPAAYALPLPGLGINAVGIPATKTFVFSMTRP